MARKHSNGGKSGRGGGGASGELSEERTLGERSGSAWTVPDGTTLGGYRVLKPLGRGGMGEVYLAENVQTGVRCALKLLPPGLSGDPTFRERFRREARVMASLDHPAIVHVSDAAEDAGRCFLVMDYVEGADGSKRTLADEMAGGALPDEKVRAYALALMGAVSYAHSAGVIHRDLKPANVLLDGAGQVHLSDFGLVRVVGEEFFKTTMRRSVSLSGAGTHGGVSVGGTHGRAGLSDGARALIGTYAYMAPECRAGRPADERSDIYSLGLILYEMLTGEKAEGAWEAPSALGHPAAWDAVVRKALAPKPERRYASVEEFADDAKETAAEAAAEIAEIAEWVGRWDEKAGLGAARTLEKHTCPDGPTPITASDFYRRAKQRERSADLRQAAVEYERACELDPGLATTSSLRTMRLPLLFGVVGGAASLDVAMQIRDRAVDLLPRRASWYSGRSEFNAGQGKDFAGALEDLNTALRLDPGDGHIYLGRAEVLLDNGQLGKALTDLNMAVRLLSDEPVLRVRANMVRAHCRRRMRQHDAAISAIERARVLDEKDGKVWADFIVDEMFWCYSARAWARYQSKDSAGAFADLDKAMGVSREMGMAYWLRGELYITRHTCDTTPATELFAALGDYDKAIEHEPDNINYFLARAHLRKYLGDYHGALADCSAALVLQPRNERVYYDRAGIRWAVGDLDGAVVDYENAVSYGGVGLIRAISLSRGMVQGQKAVTKAREDFATIADNPWYIENITNKGMWHFARQENAVALRLYELALRLDPADGRALYWRGHAKGKLGRIEDGNVDIEAAQKLGYISPV